MRTFDGFRKCVAQEFDHIYVLDFKGDAHTSGERRQREGGNIFDDKIKVGIAIYFLVKTGQQKGCTISFQAVDDHLSAEAKLATVSAAKVEMLDMKRIEPDAEGNWLDTDRTDFKSLLPLVGDMEKAVFALTSNGVVSNRDDWVYAVDAGALAKKARFFSDEYNRLLPAYEALPDKKKWQFPETIKWSRDLKRKFEQGRKSKFERKHIVPALYRPFTKLSLYSEKLFVDILTDNHYQMFGPELDKGTSEKGNVVILHTAPDSQKPFLTYVGSCIADLHFVGAAAGTTCLPLYRYDADGHRQDNLTDWGLRQFQQHYGDKQLTKRDVFHYTYAVLHHPAYRAKYEVNLKREFPRLPFYPDFRQWAKWGAQLMDLHLHYEQAKPFPLQRHDRKDPAEAQPALLADERARPTPLLDEKPKLKPRLKALKDTGVIEVDALTTLSGIPAEAWDYKLGNRSGLEWVLDQWKEHKISDPTVAEKFNTYRFADHKEEVITLLHRVCTVSVETMKIVRAMP